MVNINSLRIDSFAENILVDVSTAVGQTITSVKIWKSDEYKTSTFTDVSDLLSGISEVENFTIPAERLGLSYISGLYMIEFTSDEVISPDECCNSNNTTGVVANFVQYEECILNKVLATEIDNCNVITLSDCENCGDNVLYASMFLTSLHTAVKNGFYNEANTIMKQLDEMCEICNTCPAYGNTEIVNGTGYGTINNSVILV
jgi:hypothetical protein